MFPTLQTFTRALLTPDVSLRTLRDACVMTDTHGMPSLMRTTRFAEVEIEWQEQHYLLAMPLTQAALLHIEHTASELRRLNTELLTEYRILPDELRGSCDLVLQLLPRGCTFAEALLSSPKERLLQALDDLERGLTRLHFSHNNLKAENLRWVGDRFVPIRYHDARIGTTGADAEAFLRLREQILRAADVQSVGDAVCYYEARRRISGHLWASNLFEGRICVEDSSGYGYVDADNNPVIAARFVWAGDFHEGRAEVQTAEGMGVIDRQGCYVLPPEFEIVDYDPVESLIRTRKGGVWSTYDYLGRELKNN